MSRTVTFMVDIDSRANKSDVISISAKDAEGKYHRLGVLEADGWVKTQFLEALRRGAKALCTKYDEVNVTGTDWAFYDRQRNSGD